MEILVSRFFDATTQRVLTLRVFSPKESPLAEFPMKEWSVELYLLDADGKERPADCVTKVTYNLHPSFENPNQSKRLSPPSSPPAFW